MNSTYNINRDLVFDIDDNGLRGHYKKLFKSRFRLDVRKFVFSSRVVNIHSLMPEHCINCNAVTTFKMHISSALEPEMN